MSVPTVCIPLFTDQLFKDAGASAVNAALATLKVVATAAVFFENSPSISKVSGGFSEFSTCTSDALKTAITDFIDRLSVIFAIIVIVSIIFVVMFLLFIFYFLNPWG